MKKEKTVRSYQRRTKSGKVVTVRQHTAKYEASEKPKKKGAGVELESKRKASILEMPDYKLDMKDYLGELKKGSKKKLLRPIGSGTNGPVRRK